MIHEVRVNVDACDRPPVVKPYRTIGETARAFVAVSARARSIERRKPSVGTPQEAVIHTVRVTVDPRDSAPLIEAQGTTGTTCALIAAGARAGDAERFQLAVETAHEAVLNKVAAVVSIASHDYAKGIDVGSPRTVTTLRSVGIARAWTNPRRKRAVGIAEESVEQVVRVRVVPYNGTF